ncbi:MAG: GNAT family N-acetyltransferase [Candidatus Micrarchaeota archaeon]|nr:GNAT family N-acetyltransferase [Candidatus Micrarchaeota archaeon]
MEIRELKAEDKAQLKGLIIGVYRDSALAMWFESEPSADSLEALFTSKIDSIRDKTAVGLVAVDQGRIVGECEIVVSAGLGSVGIIVEEGHRGKGIGGELLAIGIERARLLGASRIIAEVAEENLGGRRFFEGHGFEAKGISEREFVREGKRHEVIVMERIIR